IITVCIPGMPVSDSPGGGRQVRAQDAKTPRRRAGYGMAEMRYCHGRRGSVLPSAGLFVILGALGCSSTPAPKPEPEPFVPGVPPAAAAHFTKGINLGNRLEAPNEGDWGSVIEAQDFPFIAARGFDHVR